jgi:iron complex outermembrane receptor protein
MRPDDSWVARLGTRAARFVVVALSICSLAHAEEASSRSTSDAVETIYVTATRREQDVQDVPIAMDVFDSDRLRQSRVESIADLQFLSAGLKIAGGNIVRIALRGIGPNSITPTSESGVGSFLDGVFLGSPYHQSRAFYDLERVEILRGPQGTLYGRNATVGAFNYITKAPTDVFEAGAEATLGDDDLFETTGYLSGPLVADALAARMAFRVEQHDGYAKNLNDGQLLDAADNWSVRTRLAYEPTDTIDVDLTLDYSRDDGYTALPALRSDPSLPTLYEFLAGAFFGAPPMPDDEREVDQNLIRAGEIRTQGAALDVKWDVGWATLTSITSQRDVHQDSPSGDIDFTRAPLLDFTNVVDVEQTTQDLYLVSTNEGPFDWTLGATYFREKTETSGLLTVSPFVGGGTLLLQSPELKTEAYAVYGEGTYRILDALALTAGVRYSHEKKEKHEADVCASVTCAPPGLAEFEVDDDWDEVTPHVALTYQLAEDVMLYASVGGGFKAGGFNALTPQSVSYDPEKSTTYEMGMKSDLYDRLLHLNVAAFRTDYDDLQVEQRVATPTPHLEIRNAASARVYGVEAEFVVRPVDALSFDGNVAYLDTEYEEFDEAIVDFQSVGPPVTFDATGNELSSAPEWSANLGAQLFVPLRGLGELTLRGEYSYQDDVFFTPSNSSTFTEDGYSWFNARVGFESQDSHWNVAAWVKNITDEEVFASLSPGGPEVPGFSAAIFGNVMPPRTYGATIGYRF